MRSCLLLSLVVLSSGCARATCVRVGDCRGGELCVDGECRLASEADASAGRDAAGWDAAGWDAAGDWDPVDAGDPADAGNAGATDGGVVADGGCVGPTCPGVPEHMWSDTYNAGDATWEIVRSVVTDSTGAVIFIGKNSGTLTLGSTTLVTEGLGDIVVAKLSAAGEFMWAVGFGSVEEDSGRAIAVDASDNIYVSGMYRGVMNMGGAELPYAGGDRGNLFVGSFTPAGAHRWSHGYLGAERDAGNTVAVSGNHVFVSGIFEGTLRTPLGDLSSAGNKDVFVLHYNRAGALSWQHRYGGSGLDFSLGATAASSASLFVAGTFTGTGNFGALGDRTSMGTQDLFVMEINPAGAAQRIATFGAPGVAMYGHNVAITSDNRVLVGTGFEGTLSLDGGAPTTSRARDAVALVLNSDLSYRWHETISSRDDDAIRGVAASDDGQVFVIGTIRGAGRIGAEGGPTFSGPSPGVANVFITSLAETDGAHHWTRTWSSSANGEGWGLATSGSWLYASGYVEGPSDLGGGTLPGTAARDGALAAYRIR